MCQTREAGRRVGLHQVLMLLLFLLVLFLLFGLDLVLGLHVLGVNLHQDILKVININQLSSSEKEASYASVGSYASDFAGYPL
jgi:hypothetical protein